jgi:hypothetical protein
MAHGTRNNGYIQTFWPDDTDKEFFVAPADSLSTIIERCRAKWPGCRLEDIHIEAENIHTDCLTYDLHDSGDYTNFIHITNRGII